MTEQLIVRLRNRKDFTSIASRNVFHSKAFVLQAGERSGSPSKIGVGFTCSKKVGNAVLRNAAKRRLKEISRIVMPQYGRAGWNYVLIGKKDQTANIQFSLLVEDLKNAMVSIHIDKG